MSALSKEIHRCHDCLGNCAFLDWEKEILVHSFFLPVFGVEPSILHTLDKHSSTNLYTSSSVHSLNLFTYDNFYKNEANIESFHSDLNNRQIITVTSGKNTDIVPEIPSEAPIQWHLASQAHSTSSIWYKFCWVYFWKTVVREWEGQALVFIFKIQTDTITILTVNRELLSLFPWKNEGRSPSHHNGDRLSWEKEARGIFGKRMLSRVSSGQEGPEKSTIPD